MRQQDLTIVKRLITVCRARLKIGVIADIDIKLATAEKRGSLSDGGHNLIKTDSCSQISSGPDIYGRFRK